MNQQFARYSNTPVRSSTTDSREYDCLSAGQSLFVLASFLFILITTLLA